MDAVLALLTQSDNVFFAIVSAYILQISIYFFICGNVVLFCHLMLNVLKRGQLLDDIKLAPSQVKKEVMFSFITSFIYAIYLLVCIYFSTSSVEPLSLLDALYYLLSFMVFYDFINYFTHRLFHTAGFKRFHRQHHLSTRVTPWSSSSLHPVEAVINQVPFLLFVLIIPVPGEMIILFYVYLMLGMACAHSNYNPIAKVEGFYWLKRYIRFHQRHHKHGNVNYGFLGTHWDYLFGSVEVEK